MTYSYQRSFLSLLALSCSTIAIAGDEPIYQPAPDWVEPVDLDAIERDPANDRLLRDSQIRIESGLEWDYVDEIFRISDSSDLGEVGTLTAQWLPDKGDLIVHRIAILRDGEEIDLVAQGERMEILRREQGLENRILDGSLTATMSVPGLQVGDQLRMTYSVTTSDQALGDEVQAQAYLWREPATFADFARVIVSWPEDLGVSYKAWPNYDLAPPQLSGGYNRLEVSLPLPEADEFPTDAPLRFRRSTYLQVGTFDSWAEVSSTMAPYYNVDGSLDGLDDLVAKIDAIKTDYDTDLERAVAALELVQEDIRYLLNGLDGGNYIPQDVATTWDKKYGDCKAKTVILLALLDRLGIEAEPVLAATKLGNTVPVSLPIPGAFDHVLVRATIGGNQYYLDGTSAGANIAVVGNVPGFEYALPIRADGADIEPIVQVLPRTPEFRLIWEADSRAGIDLPSLVTMKLEFTGPAAVSINANAERLMGDQKEEFAARFSESVDVADLEVVQGEDDSETTVVLTGLTASVFEFDGARGFIEAVAMTADAEFAPNRSRRDWRELPVSIGSPSSVEVRYEVKLPQGEGEYEARGETSLDTEVAGRRYEREVALSRESLGVFERITNRGGEIAPDQVRDERRKAASFQRNEIKVFAPEDAPRRWRFAQGGDRKLLKPIEAAYAKIIENDPDEADPYLGRAAFRYDVYDFAGALEDMNKVIEIEGTAEYYAQRATVHMQLLDFESASIDLEEAYLLEPTPWRAINYSDSLFDLGDLTGAREAIELEDGDQEVRQYLAITNADLDAAEGKGKEGLARIVEAMRDDENNADILGQKCWFMGVWQVEIAEGIDVCTRAVEMSGEASVLDSRAMIYYRNGMYDLALGDIEEALTMVPDQTASILLRGFVRLEQGDKGGQADIDEALARNPMLAVDYRKWGFDL